MPTFNKPKCCPGCVEKGCFLLELQCPNMQKEKKALLVQICPKRKLLLLNARREEADFVSNYGYLQKMLKSRTILDLQKTACVRTFRPKKMFLAKSGCPLCHPPCTGGEKMWADTLHSWRGQKRGRHCALVHIQRALVHTQCALMGKSVGKIETSNKRLANQLPKFAYLSPSTSLLLPCPVLLLQ